MKTNLRPISKDEHLTAIELLKDFYSELGEEAGSVDYLNTGLINQLTANGVTAIYFITCEKEVAGIVSLTESQAA